MFVDASALCAVFLREDGYEALEAKLAASAASITSAIAVWEAVRGIVRETGLGIPDARTAIQRYLAEAEVDLITLGERELNEALSALDLFGKGRHPARLNMGDCFAYACAKTHGVPLLFKGDDFSRTDIPRA
jgi:ribonuclease VapC